MTYPNEDVGRFLAERVVAFKPRIDENKDLARRFGAVWTPGLFWLAPDGTACHSNVGYFEPEELLAESVFALGRVAASRSDWKTAGERFDEVARTWPKSHASPAALYWAGAAAKQETGETAGLMASWKKLLQQHRGSAWAMKAAFVEE